MTVEGKRAVSVVVLLVLIIAAVYAMFSVDEIRENATKLSQDAYESTVGAINEGAAKAESLISSDETAEEASKSANPK